jgi:hypothetical protein
MKNKVFFVSMILCGGAVSFMCCNPLEIVLSLANEGANVSSVTITSTPV